MGRLRTPAETTTTWKVGSVIPNGIWKLICDGETKNSGAAFPFILTSTSKSLVGKGKLAATSVPGAREAPKSETIDPGLTTAACEKLAPFTSPFRLSTGAPTARFTVSACGLLLVFGLLTLIVPV